MGPVEARTGPDGRPPPLEPAPGPPGRVPIVELAPEVAEQIAAGEVIERPAAVVRELLDNALDAGAAEVRVEVRGGGLELIRVSDDGCGIPPEEVELAFRRHATSKIRGVEDLARLGTLGFRGEALPSVAAVAEVTLLTRDELAAVGTSLTVRAGQVLRRTRAARQRGTTVTVRHLFHTVPARLKFLGASRAESLLVGQLVRRYALARPGLRIALTLDGRPAFQSSGSGRLETALGEVYGSIVAEGLLPLRAEEPGCGARVSGFIGGRSFTRPGRQHLTLVVNGRRTASRGLVAALEAAYRPFLPRGRHPIGAVVLEVPPADLDPNVHPAKTEVRLRREPEVAEVVARAVREALGRTPARPRADADFTLDGTQYQLPAPRRSLAEARGPGWSAGDEDEPLGAGLARLRVVGQVQGSLILAEGPRGLFLVDQHRAHERVVYERLLRRAGPEAEGQSLLEPVLLELKPHEAARLEERLPLLEALGFRCQRFGGRDFLLRAVPVLPGQERVGEALQGLLEDAAAEGEDWQQRLQVSLACRAALRRNRPLDEAAMRELLGQLAETAAPAACPHGSPLVLHLTDRFLERQFNW